MLLATLWRNRPCPAGNGRKQFSGVNWRPQGGSSARFLGEASFLQARGRNLKDPDSELIRFRQQHDWLPEISLHHWKFHKCRLLLESSFLCRLCQCRALPHRCRDGIQPCSWCLQAQGAGGVWTSNEEFSWF